jgi:hypothetical protein
MLFNSSAPVDRDGNQKGEPAPSVLKSPQRAVMFLIGLGRQPLKPQSSWTTQPNPTDDPLVLRWTSLRKSERRKRKREKFKQNRIHHNRDLGLVVLVHKLEKEMAAVQSSALTNHTQGYIVTL